MDHLDLREFVSFNIKCVHFFGYFTPEFTTDSVKKLLFRIYATLFVGLFFVLMFLSQMAAMVAAIGDMEAMTEASFLFFTNIVQSFKLYSFLVNGPRIWKLVHSMNRKIFQPQNWVQYRILTEEIRKSKIISKVLLFMCTVTCLSWAMSPFLDNKSKTNGRVRLPLSGWYPFDTKQSPIFEIVYAYQILSTWVGGLGDLSMDTFMSGAIMVISGQLSVLNNAFSILKHEKKFWKNCNESRKSLIRNIYHHRNIIQFSEEVTVLFTACITGQFVVGVVIVCMSMFQMSLVSVMSFRFFAMMMYQICVLLEIYLWCYYGNEVILKSEKLTESAYNCQWIDEAKEFKKDLLFFLTRSQISLKLYAGGYFTLSLDTFKAIAKSSWSYFAVLRTVHSDSIQ